MISVIIPTRNRSDLLLQVLPSYFSQKDVLEIILVDDSTQAVHSKKIRDFAQKNPKLVLIQDGKPAGLPAARNKGMRRAKGSHIFVGEDDVWLPQDHLKILLDHLVKNDADVLGGRKIWLHSGETIDEALMRADQRKVKPFNTFLMNFNSDVPGKEDVMAPFLQNNALMKKGVFEKVQYEESYVGFAKGYSWRDETDFYMSVNEKGFKVLFCPHVFVFNFLTQTGGTHSFSRWKKEYWILRNQYYLLKKHKRFIQNILHNPYPLSLLWSAYALTRIYGHLRNGLWFLKQRLRRVKDST